MDGKTKLIFSGFILAILALSIFCYQKYVINNDYSVYAEALCDPSVEICFVYVCDPEIEECTGNPEEDTSYYKEVVRMANRFPNCDPNSDECLIAQCAEGEIDCRVTLCDPSDTELLCSSVDDFNHAESTMEDTTEDGNNENTGATSELDVEN